MFPVRKRRILLRLIHKSPSPGLEFREKGPPCIVARGRDQLACVNCLYDFLGSFVVTQWAIAISSVNNTHQQVGNVEQIAIAEQSAAVPNNSDPSGWHCSSKRDGRR